MWCICGAKWRGHDGPGQAVAEVDPPHVRPPAPIPFRPLESYDQRLIASSLVISPEPVSLRYVHDVFGNCVGIARFGAPTEELSFESRVTLDHTPLPAFAGVD